MSRYLTKSRKDGKPLFPNKVVDSLDEQIVTELESTMNISNISICLNESTPNIRQKRSRLGSTKKLKRKIKNRKSYTNENRSKKVRLDDSTNKTIIELAQYSSQQLDNNTEHEGSALNTEHEGSALNSNITVGQIESFLIEDGINSGSIFENTVIDETPPSNSYNNICEKSISINNSKNDILENTALSKDDHLLGDLTQLINDNNRLEYPTGTFYGLPLKVKEMLKSQRGIDKLYDWQDECLSLQTVLKHDNVIYSLPTSGGKTLVAEVIMMNELLNKYKNVLLVLPYVSIVQEKVRTLSPFAVEFSFHIEEYAASKGCIPPRKRRKNRSIYVATIEKGNAIVNSLIETERILELGLVVIDELHMIGDGGSRGALLETLLSKLMFKFSHTQIIGMSATLGNITELQKFLKAEVYTNNFRPVELKEYVKLDDVVYHVNSKNLCEEDLFKPVRKLKYSTSFHSSIKSQDPDHVVPLVLEVIPQYSCLVFCPTKKNCENVALMISKFVPKDLLEVRKEERLNLLRTIHQSVNGVCKVLLKTIPFGVAYHHSGLTLDERKLIEEAYSTGVLCLLCCTSTLAAGVNLPAKRAILRSPYVGKSFMLRSQYKQMVGRAGRAGLDSSGESILIISRKDKDRIKTILDGPVGCCNSSMFYENGKGLRALILNLLGLKICISLNDLKKFLESTFFFIQHDKTENNINNQIIGNVTNEVDNLKKIGLLEDDIDNSSSEDVITATKLGTATFKAFIDLDHAPFIYKQLNTSLGGLVLADELHLLYLATPLEQVNTVYVNWMTYYNMVSKMTTNDMRAAELIGVTESMLTRKACGQRYSKDKFDEYVYKRFYLTLMLYGLIRKKSIWEISTAFNTTRGFLQGLLSSTISFASSLVHFTQEICEFWTLKVLFEELLKRLNNTTDYELEELLEIPGVKQARARQLYKKGYHKLKDIAQVNAADLCQQIDHLPRKQANLIIASAKMLLQERIESLRDEADDMCLTKDT